jgi:hypothetical protein
MNKEWRRSQCCTFYTTSTPESPRPRSCGSKRSDRYQGLEWQEKYNLEGEAPGHQDCSLGQIRKEGSIEKWATSPGEPAVLPFIPELHRGSDSAVPFIPELYRDSDLEMTNPPKVTTSSYQFNPNVSASLLKSSLAKRNSAGRNFIHRDDETASVSIGPRAHQQAACLDADSSAGAAVEARPARVIRYLSL